ncbi:MAG: ParA family protein [Cyanobacteria bacterium J06649_4]
MQTFTKTPHKLALIASLCKIKLAINASCKNFLLGRKACNIADLLWKYSLMKRLQIAIASSKGGVGKSAVSIHVCYALAERGFNVVLADADSNQSSTYWAERADKNGHSLGFEVIDGIDEEIPEDCEILWIDTQGNPDLSELEVLSQNMDLVILPCGVDAGEVTATLRSIQEAKLEVKNYRILLTRIPPNPNKRGENLHKQFQEAGLPIFDILVRSRVCHYDANENGLTLGQMKGKAASSGAKEYAKLADEILNLLGEDS